MPSATRVPTSLSESTWFFGQPRVSTQKLADIGPTLLCQAMARRHRPEGRPRPAPPGEPGELRRADLATLAVTYLAAGITTSVVVSQFADAWVVVLAAVIMYSATGELALVAVLASGGSVVAGVLSGLLVSARFGLLCVALASASGRRCPSAYWRRSSLSTRSWRWPCPSPPRPGCAVPTGGSPGGCSWAGSSA
ncbi:MAG: hypothetical protein GEV08_14185, partial [Acidimicrobiia bacterium]|nr:hypothetical protein [Acidimicrobiia bacterium]